jgi:adenylate cyclase
VNLAARLENSGEVNCIHVSGEVRERLAEDFEFRSRGLVEIKGVGQKETFFLVGPRNASEPAREAAA